MFAIGDLQQTTPNTAWIWYGILIIIVLVVIFLLLNRRSERPAEVQEESVSPKTKASADDLIKIEGIGPKVARVLNDAGITTFEALANANPAEVQKTLNAAGLQMMNPEGWIEQATLAAKGDWENLERLQGKLKGGRKK